MPQPANIGGPPAPSIAEPKSVRHCTGRIVYARFRCRGFIPDSPTVWWAILEEVDKAGKPTNNGTIHYLREGCLIDGEEAKAEIEERKP